MTMRLEKKISPVGLREGHAPLIDPSPFVRAYDSSIRAGQQLQNLGGQLGDLAIAEQNVYNATQTDLLNIERKTKMNAFLNKTRNGGNPQYLEQDYNTAYKQINKDIIKKAPNDRIRALVEAEGQSYLASNLPSIQKEARVYRLNGLKTGVEETVQLMRGSLINTDDPLLKQETADSINQLLSTAVANGIMLPSEASDALLKIDKDVEAAFIRRKMNAADTIEEFDEALGKAQYMDEETKEIRRDQFRIRLRERRSLKLREEEALYQQGVRDRKEVHRVGDAAIRDRANDPNPLKRPDNDELDRLLGEDKISTSAYKDVKTEILNPPTAEPETNWDTYEDINEKIHHEDGPQVSASYIGNRKDLASAQKTTLLAQHQAVEHGTDPRIAVGYKTLKVTIGTPEAATKWGKLARSKEMKVLYREYIDRIQGRDGRKKEDPIDVANDISDRWLDADNVTSDTSQNRTARRLLDISAKYRMSSYVNGLNIPDTFGMRTKINNDHKNKILNDQQYVALNDHVANIEETWSIEKQELHGGTKKADTLAAIAKAQADEAALKQKQADDLAAKKAEEERQIQLEEDRKQAAIQHKKEMEAREVVQEQEREQLASKKQQAEADKQMSSSLQAVSDIAKSFNIDPGKLAESGSVLYLSENPYNLGEFDEARQQDKKRMAELTGRGQQATAQVEKEVARLGETTGKQERLAVTSSEAKVLAKRAKEKKAEEERESAREKQLQETKKKQAEQKKADEKLLKRLQELENRKIGEEFGKKLSPAEVKELDKIKKEVKTRKLTPLPLG